MITRDRLRAALDQLPPDAQLEGNAMGNLMVLSGDDEYLGYIDCDTGEVSLQRAGENDQQG